MEDWIQNWFPNRTLKTIKSICTLWAGYGELYRVHFEDGTIIVKHIQITKERSTSSERKMKSYFNECSFYSNIGIIDCRIPKYICHQISTNDIYLGLEDLASLYPNEATALNRNLLEKSPEWLAEFHALNWNQKKPTTMGGYWYLDTRREELDKISPRFKHLKENADLIDVRCRDVKYETVLHGDSKSENILWDKDFQNCAFVDFQYTGVGLGAKDVAYLVCSSAEPNLLKSDWFLEFYFECFENSCKKYCNNMNGYTLNLFKLHFEWCLLDYVRFMAGWGFWGNYRWAISRTSKLLE